MDCIFGPVWLHSVDWTHRVGSTAAGVFQEATCEVTENSDAAKNDETWQSGQSHRKSTTEHWSLFNEHWKISRATGETTCNLERKLGDSLNRVMSGSHSFEYGHSTEHCTRALKRDPVVYSNPFDPVLMFNGILSDVIGRKGHRSETGNGKEEKRSDNCGGDICADSLSERSMSQDAASVFERHVTHHDDHVLRMRDPTALSTSSSTHALQSVTCGKCERDTVPVAKDADVSTPVSVDLRGAGDDDDVARMARAVFSDRVRLLWSDCDMHGSCGSAGDSGGGGGGSRGSGGSYHWGGRWPSPGPVRRPLYIPWRLRHYLAYLRRSTPDSSRNDVRLDSMLVQFKEMRLEELASKSTRFVVADSVMRNNISPKGAATEALSSAATRPSSKYFPATTGLPFPKNGRRFEASLAKPRNTELGAGWRGTTTVGMHNDVESALETDVSSLRLSHSLSDSDLYKFVEFVITVNKCD